MHSLGGDAVLDHTHIHAHTHTRTNHGSVHSKGGHAVLEHTHTRKNTPTPTHTPITVLCTLKGGMPSLSTHTCTHTNAQKYTHTRTNHGSVHSKGGYAVLEHAHHTIPQLKLAPLYVQKLVHVHVHVCSRTRVCVSVFVYACACVCVCVCVIVCVC